MKQSIKILFLSLLFFSLSIFSSNSFSQSHPFLKYFPSNEKITSVSTDGLGGYPKSLQEITNCNPPLFDGVDLNQALADCRTCVSLKNTCPTCCIDPATADYSCATKPTNAGNSGGYDPAPFGNNCDGNGRVPIFTCDPSTGVCSIDPVFDQCDAANRSAIPQVQRDGCPRNTSLASVTLPDACVVDDKNIVYCTNDNIVPMDRGCVPLPEAQVEPSLAYDPIFHSASAAGSDFYTITDVTGSCPASAALEIQKVLPGFDPLSDPCYRYTDGAFAVYFNACPGYADAAEAGYKDNRCCQEADQCQPDGMGSCDTRPGGSCKSIINDWSNLIYVSPGVSKNCYDIEPFECIALQEVVQNCINNDNPRECSSCFDEIDPNFSYDFVAKSGESLVILWRIDSVPEVPVGMSPAFNTYFYSKIIVRDTTDNKALPLASNIVHQRNFTDAFNISSAIAINNEDLIVGHTYEARIYYFIPNDSNIPTGEHLKMIIGRMEMDVFSVRE